jgi:signal transduction histidine kinase
MIALAELVAGWPLAVSAAAGIAAGGLRATRRRAALNEALHELRRPLQAISLAAAGGPGSRGGVDSSVQLAAAALERLDREINGGTLRERREEVAMRGLLESAVRRWQVQVALAGGSLALRWRAGDAIVEGARAGLAQAIDNLIANAIEHGGDEIVVEARRQATSLRIAIADSGCGSRPAARRETPAETIARLAGRRRRGHGLPVVRRVAAAHDGRFMLRRGEQGSLAVLELPLAVDGAERAA